MFLRFLFLILLIVSFNITAKNTLQGVDLWLPITYQDQYTLLVEAAKKAQADDYCHQLLSGRLNESKSNKSYLYFHFRCRTEDRTIFSIQVEGPEMTLSNKYSDKQKELKIKQQKEAARLEAEKEAELSRQKQREQEKLKQEQAEYWGICQKALKKRLKYFVKVQILSETLPEPDINGLEFAYIIDFDALSSAKKPLHFRASCVISGLDKFKVKVKARKNKK